MEEELVYTTDPERREALRVLEVEGLTSSSEVSQYLRWLIEELRRRGRLSKLQAEANLRLEYSDPPNPFLALPFHKAWAELVKVNG